MRHHIGQIGARTRKLLLVGTKVAVEQRELAVHHLVVRYGKHEPLAEGVGQGEGELVVMLRTEVGILLEIGERIVHPAHVPLHGKAKSAVFKACDVGPRGGFLGHGHHVGMAFGQNAVELLEEGNGLEALASAVDVWHPLAGALVVIEIEHGGDRVHAKPVQMVLLDPEEGVGDEEGLHLLASHVKLARAPGLMLHAVRALVFVQGLSVKLTETVRVLRKMRGDPIQDHADARLVKGVDEGHKLLGRAEARGGGVVAADLVAPGAVEGELAHGQDLNMRVAHLLDVGHELRGKLTVGIGLAVLVPPPRAQMQLIDVDGLGKDLFSGKTRFAVAQPALVVPDVARKIGDHRGGLGGALHGKAVGIGLEELAAVIAQEEFVVLPLLDRVLGESDLPDAVRHLGQGSGIGIPGVEIANHRDEIGVWRPDAKEELPVFAVRTQVVVGVRGGSLVEEIGRLLVRAWRATVRGFLLLHGSILSFPWQNCLPYTFIIT